MKIVKDIIKNISDLINKITLETISKLMIFVIIILIIATLCSGCSDSEVVNHNLTKDADNFKVYRHIVFINNITGEYLLEITGYCNINADTEDKQLETICRDNNGNYIKNFLGINETTTYFVEQIDSKYVSSKHYKLVIKPSELIPFVEVR